MNFRHWIAGVVAVSATGLASTGYAQGVTAERQELCLILGDAA